MLSDGRVKVSCEKYIREILRKYEGKYGTLSKENVPSNPNLHLELDTSPLLDDIGVELYQRIMGQCQWALNCGRMDISQAVASLNRFQVAPRKKHMQEAWKVLGFLKKYPKRGFVVDSRDPILDFDKLVPKR